MLTILEHGNRNDWTKNPMEGGRMTGRNVSQLSTDCQTMAKDSGQESDRDDQKFAQFTVVLTVI